MDLLEQLHRFIPFNDQEARDQRLLNTILLSGQDVFTRENAVCHVTASAWVVNPHRTKALMVYHNIYHSWSWMGGHADGQRDLLQTAMREVREESGLRILLPISESLYSVEILTVDGHLKNGAYISSHLHLNFTYLLEADESEPLRVKPDENSGVRWFALNEAMEASTEPWFRERVYAKLNQKLALI